MCEEILGERRRTEALAESLDRPGIKRTHDSRRWFRVVRYQEGDRRSTDLASLAGVDGQFVRDRFCVLGEGVHICANQSKYSNCGSPSNYRVLRSRKSQLVYSLL